MQKVQYRPLNPLSVWTYLCRNKKTLPVLIVIVLVVFGITTLFTLLDSLTLTNDISHGRLDRLSIVGSSDPAAIARIRVNPHVKAVYRETFFTIQVPTILANTLLGFFAVPQDSVSDLLALYHARLIAGRLPEPQAAEFAVSEKIAKARGWGVGSIVGPSVDKRDGLAVDFTLVGILESDKPIGFIPFEYLSREPAFFQGDGGNFLVIPKEGEKEAMDRFLIEEIASRDTAVVTYDQQEREARQRMTSFYVILGAIDLLIIAVLTVTTGMLNYIFLTQRIGEFALFQAMGYGKGMLARRVVGELSVLTGLAWLVGELLSLGTLLAIATSVFAPRGLDFHVFDPGAVAFTLPIPIIVAAVGAGTVLVLLARLDPVSIIERRA